VLVLSKQNVEEIFMVQMLQHKKAARDGNSPKRRVMVNSFGMISPLKHRSFAIFICLALFFFVGVGTSAAALPAPNFLPGQPMMAGTQVIMMWMPVPGAVKYRVYLNGEQVAEAPGNQYIAPAPEASGDYFYEVVAIDEGGAESPKSSKGKISIVKLEAPIGLSARAVGEQKEIGLRWSSVPSAVMYNVYRSQEKDGSYEMVASVQSDSYKDAKVEFATYYYKVSARDMGGKESPQSEPIEVVLEKPVERVVIKIDFKIAPTKEISRIEWLGDETISQVSDVKREKGSNDVWVVDPGRKKIYVLNTADGSLSAAYGPFEFKPYKLDFSTNGNVYVGAEQSGYVQVMDPGGKLAEKIKLSKPPYDREDIWKGLPGVAKNYGPIAGDVLCLENEFWVNNQMFGLIEVFNYSGEFQRYLFEYTDSEDKKVRFPSVGEMELLPSGNILITFPLGHYAVAVDPSTMKEIFNIGKITNGFVGGFIGIHGVDVMPDGNILLTDPGVTTMQVFDGKTGEYLYHFGGPEAVEDPEQPGRPLVYVGGISFAQFTSKGELFLYSGNEKTFSKRTVGEPVLVERKEEKH